MSRPLSSSGAGGLASHGVPDRGANPLVGLTTSSAAELTAICERGLDPAFHTLRVEAMEEAVIVLRKSRRSASAVSSVIVRRPSLRVGTGAPSLRRFRSPRLVTSCKSQRKEWINE